ncbi:MAG: Y-family DNA polymerase [Desulfovibrio sp.]|jgi:DNA polymerase V|nr:Y-family DNA polymerase [Desulfovibrio sp.]
MQSTNSTPTLWALVDCNNFFASCERLFRPDLAGRPVVVLSSNDGCIVARSNEAKALGIGMGEPEFMVRDLLLRHKVAVFSSNYALYGDISARVMLTLESLAPVVEQYSIDEAFLPLQGAAAANADELALNLRERVRKWTGIPVTVGIGPTRTLAKLAAETAKKGTGLLRLNAGDAESDRTLAATPVADIWGIGRKSAEKLRLCGIRTAGELRDADGGILRKILGICGLHTSLELRGIPCLDRSETPISRRSMVSSRSFGQKVAEKEDLAEALAMHAALAGERLRREKLEAGGLAVHIRTALYGQEASYDRTANVTLPSPAANTKDLVRAAKEGLEAVFRPGYAYAKAGIMLFDLVPAGGRQGNLLEWAGPDEGKRRDRKLMSALDAVNRRFGRGTLRFAAEGRKDAPWRSRQDRRSPRWTTEWSELPRAGETRKVPGNGP